jgi:gamma-glutamyltranspeptidase/glutathione hydrolase
MRIVAARSVLWRVASGFLAFCIGSSPLLAAAPEPASGTHGLVVSPHPDATRAGVATLERGGNAVDAAITAAFALAVAQPQSTGIGGGAFVLIRLSDGSAFAIDGRETAPGDAALDYYQKPGVPDDAARLGGRAVGTPGLVAGFALALERFGSGKVSFAQALAPAIELAEKGYPAGPYSLGFFSFLRRTPLPVRFPETARIQLPPEPVAIGTRVPQTDLAATLRTLAAKGPRALYEGELAEKIAAAVRANGGTLAAADLSGYQAVLREPLRGSYRGRELVAFPLPSSGGVTLLEALNVLEGFDLAAMGAGSSAATHTVAEALKLAFADRALYLGDPAFVKVPSERLLDKAYAVRLRSHIRAKKATPVAGGGLAVDDAGTAHLSVVDGAGNAVSITQTINGPYGSWVTVPGTGILLNNEMDDFVTRPGQANQWGLASLADAANRVEPGKRPLSSMAPVIVLENGHVRLVAGSNGGPRIISAVLIALLNALDFGMDIQEAVSTPRFHHQWRPDVLEVEKEMPADVIAGLRKRGHTVEVVDEIMTGVEAIAVDPKTGVMTGGLDPRRDGLALGL